MKRLTSLALSLVMLLPFTVSAARAAEAAPTPPAWVKAEEYLVFSGDPVYEKETWDKILKLREDAAAGHLEPKSGAALYSFWRSGLVSATSSPGLCFELGLIGMRYAENTETRRETNSAMTNFVWTMNSLAQKSGSYLTKDYQLVKLWYERAQFLHGFPSESRLTGAAQNLKGFLKDSGYTLEEVKAYQGMSAIPAEEWSVIEAAKTPLESGRTPEVWLDGVKIGTGVIKGRSLMVPVRQLTELLGGQITYVQRENAAYITRAGAKSVLPLGKSTATANGKAVKLDAAPYQEGDDIYIPASCIPALFGQKLEWRHETCCVMIREDKSSVGTSNLEAWALPMGAMLARLNSGSYDRFGIYGRGAPLSVTTASGTAVPGREHPYQRSRNQLSHGWGINSREDLILTVLSMTYHGHNDSFLHDAAVIGAMTPAQYQTVLKNAQGMDAYMFPYTKQLGEKWGARGILCWDLFRMSDLVQWGYAAGYITYPEALALLEPAATLLHDNFKSWDEAYENYLDGYNWWARNNVLNQNIWETERGRCYQNMKAADGVSPVFDDSLFKAPVSGVPGLTAEQVLASIQ